VTIGRSAVLATVLAVLGRAADAAPVTVGPLTFDDRMGGLVLHGGSGSGTMADPFVLFEDITDDGPAILAVSGLLAEFGNRVGTQHAVGFALTKVVRNLTSRPWEVFEVELREVLRRSSPYQDGLSFAQDAVKEPLLGSDRFTHVMKTDEPLDAVVYSGAMVQPGETVAIRMVITDYSPSYEFYVLQRRNAPVAQIEGGTLR
jgi:hypothetical protein